MAKPDARVQHNDLGVNPHKEMKEAFEGLCFKKAREIHDMLCTQIQQSPQVCVNPTFVDRIQTTLNEWKSAVSQHGHYSDEAASAERDAQLRAQQEYRDRQQGSGRVTRRNRDPF